ncbi:MAG: RNA polymerase sigma factor [Marinilabiliales bacterium]|nr:RNA polymerase sigma factor [Marinilabiliales bacterium]
MTVKEYNKVVDDHADALYRFILKNLKDGDRANDIVQDSFEKLWLNVAEIDADVAKSWLFTTAYHKMIDSMRRESKIVLTESYDDQNLIYNGSYSDLKELLNIALDRLQEQQKTVILLRDYEGYSYKEIAEITGLSEPVVKISIYRGRIELRKFIGKIEAVV